MSASIVNEAHIDALVQAAITAGVSWYHKGRWLSLGDGRTPDSLGRMLWKENFRSVRYRYPDDPPDLLPGPVPTPNPNTYKFTPTEPLTPVQVLKAIACYEYESCEHPGWRKSETKVFCDALRKAVIRQLPGYEEAEWEIPDHD